MALVLMSRGSSWRKYCGMKRWQKQSPNFSRLSQIISGSVSWAGHIVYGYGIPSRVARRLRQTAGSTFSLAQSPEDAPARKDKR